MARPTRELRLSRRAEADLEAIYDYTVQRWSVRQATAYLAGLDALFKSLRTGQRVGHDADVGSDLLKIAHEAHVVYYRAAAEGIDVVRILHAAMDAPRHLRE